VRGRRRRSTPRRAAPTIPPGGVGTAGKGPAARTRNPILRFFAILGPGLITGASDDDPSGIGTYAVAGASFGFATLWTALLTFPMMTAVQLTCAKIGMVTGMGLARVLRQHYPRALLYPVVGALVIANTMNAGADIGAMAEAVNLLVPVPPRALIVPIALAILALQVWGSYQLISRVFKWLSLALLAYIGSALYARPDAGAVLRGTFVPTIHFDARFISTLVALLGTTISPYLFFWQASEEVEEEISMGRRTLASRQGATDRELRYAGIDVTAGMFFSNLVMYFIILATAATLFQAGKTEIGSATEAAQALRPLAGNAAAALLAIGLIGAGFLGVPVLTGSSAYAMAEAMGWKHGLSEKPRRAKLFYAMIVVPTLVGMCINFVGINPISALFWSAVLNGLIAPPILVVVMLVANNPRVMGKRVNALWSNMAGWATTALMALAAVALLAAR
jgi:NRAMP (natural resistance-associated macrophage protein)-like metal ion transporter